MIVYWYCERNHGAKYYSFLPNLIDFEPWTKMIGPVTRQFIIGKKIDEFNFPLERHVNGKQKEVFYD